MMHEGKIVYEGWVGECWHVWQADRCASNRDGHWAPGRHEGGG